MNSISLGEAAYSSEWFLARFFQEIMNNNKIQKYFKLDYISGREKSKEEVIKRIPQMIQNVPKEYEGAYSQRNNLKKNESLKEIEFRLKSNSLEYLPLYEEDNKTISSKLFEKSEALYISTSNSTHSKLIAQAIAHGKPVLCEKPICVVLDENLQADDSQLKELKIFSNYSGVAMDAEHYSYKPVSMNFYENLEKILCGRKIIGVEGKLIEHDDPFKNRNLSLLSRDSRTGILLDTGVHLISFLSNLGYLLEPINASYGKFSSLSSTFLHKKIDYETETGAEVEYQIHSTTQTKKNLIKEGSNFHLSLEKFGQYRCSDGKKMNPSKNLCFILEDQSQICLNFDEKKGTIVERIGEYTLEHVSKNRGSSEYTNILLEFNNAIKNKDYVPRSDFRNSIRTLEAIFKTYSKFPLTDPKNFSLEYSFCESNVA